MLKEYHKRKTPGEENRHPLVFIPGLKGSQLHDSRGRVHWVTGAQALGIARRRIDLPAFWVNGRQPDDGLLNGPALGRVTVVPGLLKETVYAPWLTRLKSRARAATFTYDWRRDNFESAAKLEKYLLDVSAAHQGWPIDVVAHSMGGMLAIAILKRHPGLIRRLVFAGVPFHGGVGFLPDMQFGSSTGLNRGLLSARTLFTFPSVCAFFAEGREVTVDASGKPLALDYFDVDEWKRHKLGIFAAGPVSAADEAFFAGALARGREFRRLMTFPAKTPPIMVIVSRGHKTLNQAMKGGPKAVMGWDFETCLQHDGDGRVAAENLPPKEIITALLETRRDHSNLLNDPTVQKGIFEFLE